VGIIRCSTLVHHHPRKQRKEPGQREEVSIDHTFAAEKGKLSLEFSDLEIES
jgi:hypothetical protein